MINQIKSVSQNTFSDFLLIMIVLF